MEQVEVWEEEVEVAGTGMAVEGKGVMGCREGMVDMVVADMT
jgi:hypothetical protein